MSSAPHASGLSAAPESGKIGLGQWMVLAAALLGWLFDGAEMGVFSLVGRSAIQDLLQHEAVPTPAQEAAISQYFGIVIATFLVGAATGGVLFGWLGDRIGRVRAMTLSVLTYALFTGACGLANSVWQLAALRFVASLGMGGEWSLGVALVMEAWPNRSRALMAGLIGAAANLGYFLVALISIGLVSILQELSQVLISIGLPEVQVARLASHQGWRMMMMVGTTPALLTFFFRLFVPESERWQAEKGKGTTSYMAVRDLVGVLVGALGPAMIIAVWAYPLENTQSALALRVVGTLVGIILATAGYVYPVVKFLERLHTADTSAGGAARVDTGSRTVRRMLLGAGLAGVALLGTWGSMQWAPTWAGKLTAGQTASQEIWQKHPKEFTQMASALGSVVGTILAALMGDWLGRRPTYRLLCLASMASIVLLYQGNQVYGLSLLVCTFVAGTCTGSFYGWLPLYLPELFGTNVRATGQGFCFNFGRILAAVGVLQTSALMGLFQGDHQIGTWHIAGGYPLACSVLSLIYVVGLLLIGFAPETRGQPLPD